MKPELRERILAYNRALAERKEKAEDLDVIAAALLALPPGAAQKAAHPGGAGGAGEVRERSRSRWS